MHASRGNTRVTVVSPSSGWLGVSRRELWAYRELLYFFVWRDLKVRYKQTILGVGWAIVQPVFLMLVFSLFFGTLAGIQTNGVPYPVFAFAALLPWTLFSRGLTDASTSLSANRNLITKVFFPRILLPAAAVLAAVVDFAIAFAVLVFLMFYYGIVPSLAVLALPLFTAMAILASMGIGFWFSALDAKYRDIKYTLPFLTQFWLFVTPVVYPTSLVPDAWRWLYSLNPMVGVVDGFRWALLGQAWAVDSFTLLSVAVTLILFAGGIVYFGRAERSLADVV